MYVCMSHRTQANRTYSPHLYPGAVVLRGNDARSNSAEGRSSYDREAREKKTRETQKGGTRTPLAGYAIHSRGAFRITIRAYSTCVRACVRHKNNAIAPLPRRALSNYDKTGRARSPETPERDYVTHTCMHTRYIYYVHLAARMRLVENAIRKRMVVTAVSLFTRFARK